MNPEEKELRHAVTKAKRQIAMGQARYFEAAAKLEAKYGDATLGTAYAKKVKIGKKPTKKPVKTKVKTTSKKSIPFECQGNVVTGEPCQVSKDERVKAADTNWNKKKHATCKACKKLIQKAKKGENK